MTSEPEIIFEQKGVIGLITLNRPKALNALNLPMTRAMKPQLDAWAQDDAIEAVVIQATGDKAFCAGGDIRALYESGKGFDDYGKVFYREEYQLNRTIKQYPKPYIAMLDGIVMGGGVGLSVHGAHRVIGDKVSFAMPETGIGLFPDVGGAYFLPRLPHHIGTYMAMTGARLKAAEVMAAGIGTERIPSDQFDDVIEALASGSANVGTVLHRFAVDPETPDFGAPVSQIDAAFGADSVEQIVTNLRAGGEWAQKQAATMATKSPTSLKVALRQLQEGAHHDYDECARMEYRIACRFVDGVDFYEGVRATIIDKDGAPNWQPGQLADVSDGAVDAYFASLGQHELEF